MDLNDTSSMMNIRNAGLVRESACTELKELLKDTAKDLEFIQFGT